MQVEFPEKINLPAVGEDKAGTADLQERYGAIRLGLHLSNEVRRQLGNADRRGRLQIFASVVSPSSSGGPTVLQLSAEREGTAANGWERQTAEVPAEVAALVTALGGRVRTEVADVNVSPDTALEIH